MSHHNLALDKARAARTSVTRSIQLLRDITLEVNADNNKLTNFLVRYSELDKIYDQFKKLQDKVISLVVTVDSALLEEEYNLSAVVDTQYFEIKEFHYKYMESQKLNKSEINPSQVINNKHEHSNARLPKITIPTFNGNIKEWTTFHDLFKTVIHENQSLSNVEKFQYLLSYLDGEPLQALKAFPLSEVNYLNAYDKLINRYNNRRKLAIYFWEQICHALPAKGDSKSLRKLIDIFSENINILENLDLPVKNWDFVLFHLLLTKLDDNTHQRFDRHNNTLEIPTFHTLQEFVIKQCQALEASEPIVKDQNIRKNISLKSNEFKSFNNKKHVSSTFIAKTSEINYSNVCHICKDLHPIYKCESFIKKSPNQRYLLVKDNKLCINCLSRGHTLSTCKSSSTCKVCQKKHHTMLHFEKSTENQNKSNVVNFPQTEAVIHSSAISMQSYSAVSTLLATACIEIRNSRGLYQPVRVILDTGSQTNFITKACANKLGLNHSKMSLSVHGIGNTPLMSSGCISTKIRSLKSNLSVLDIECCILDKICDKTPHIPLSLSNSLSNLDLADPRYNLPGCVDLLLGAEIFPQILLDGKCIGTNGQPIALNTIFGWVLMGRINNTQPKQLNCLLSTSLSNTDQIIKRFWEVEEISNIKSISPEDAKCEKHFIENTFRNASGRYVVSLAFKNDDVPYFENSRNIALRRFYLLENRLSKDDNLKNSYAEFMQDYLSSGHMSLATFAFNNAYYIPHHCVVRPDSPSTKLRVVFDASAKSSNRISLNDTLLTGPKLQLDISILIHSFRLHPIVFTADMRQMYRQILINEKDRDYQRILWRFNPSEPIKEFVLNTVTYGVKSSPFLALRTIIQLAEDEKSRFPRASDVLRTCVYVDDIVTGAASINEAIALKNELISILNAGGFELRKWSSNSPEFLKEIPESHQLPNISFDSDSLIKILGLQWNPSSDTFSYNVKIKDRDCTKRIILSELASIFDPLGFLTPLTFFAKHLMQYLWTLGLNWDDVPPESIVDKWRQYKTQLQLLSQIHIPRYLSRINNNCIIASYSDASEKGYAAVVYFRFQDSSGNISVSLVAGKSKVAPLKRISLPRLELCAAVLLSELIHTVIKTFEKHLSIQKIYAWSDSTIALSWIRSSPHRWKTFVSNRVSYIQDRVSPQCWHHISSTDNPADCASRGLLPADLIDHPLWWSGPSWLLQPEDTWPLLFKIPENQEECELEQKVLTLLSKIEVENNLCDYLLSKYSSLDKILRIMSYCYFFLHKNTIEMSSTSPYFINKSLKCLIKHVQITHFENDILRIKTNVMVSKQIRKLSPFVDNENILRVGGRLKHSSLSYEAKHPILLPRNHRFTHLLIQKYHNENMHCGHQTLQNILIQEYWILSAKRAINHILSQCFKCFKANPKTLQPPMGDLPSVRVNQIKPFSCVGIDYGGPFKITMNKSRGAKSFKAYICIFVCCATKAIHIELVTDLSTECFLAALRRFIARRGRCSEIRSDCGTNFVGAKRELNECMKNVSESEGIKWHFNPPSAPHFGGLWEAGIKSVKTHLTRVIGDQILTYEELNTVLIQIEAILNSRPLTTMSNNPNDFTPLTPGHFLTLEPLKSLPEYNFTQLNISRLNRWQLIQKLHQDFWVRWHKEYLHTLSQKSKWHHTNSTVHVNQMVLIKNDNMSPLHWRLGRIIECYPGSDGIVRVVSVRTTNGILRRPVVKLCILPQCH